MQDKEIDPFGYYIVSADADNFLEVTHFIIIERRSTRNCAITNLRNYAIKHDDFGARFTPLKLAMNVNWLMFVGVEHDN
jgi:hypothetical protein